MYNWNKIRSYCVPWAKNHKVGPTLLGWYGTFSHCDVLAVEIINKINCDFIIFSFTKPLPNNVAQWFRAFTEYIEYISRV